MDHFLTLMLMSTLVDGRVHEIEIQLIRNYTRLYPGFSGLSDGKIKKSADELNLKLNSGFDEKTVVDALLREMSEQLSEPDREMGYALACEVCASNFELHPEEQNFIGKIEEIFGISEDVIGSVSKSVMLRYGLQMGER